MTNEMKLLMALCDALGFDVACTNENYKLTEKVSALGCQDGICIRCSGSGIIQFYKCIMDCPSCNQPKGTSESYKSFWNVK